MTTDGMKLRIIPTPEGYFDGLRNRYFYNYTDHLGNVRLSYSDADANGEVTGDIIVNNCYGTPNGQVCNNYIITGEAEGVTNYYPFGLMHNAQSYSFDNAYQYKYNGKELQETGMYDYGARFYMPDIGRWGVVDPLAEVSRRWSPYTYVLNNPIKFVDPDGREVVETASGTTYTGADAQSAFLALKNQLGNGPGPKGSWGGVSWQKYVNNWYYEDGAEHYRADIKARVGTLKSINGNATLNVKQTIGQWDKEYGFLPVNRTNFANENAMQVTNCYGYVLTNGYFFVDDSIENIRSFLLDSGYKSAQVSNKTNFKTGDILLWEGHMMEAVGSKNGKVQWESYFGFDSSPVKGSLQQVMNYNKEVSGGGYGSLQGATLYRQQDQSKIQFGQKKYESVDVKTIQQQRNY